jgi:hypothetical protein
MLWKWPTTQSVLWMTRSSTIVALISPCKPATSHEHIATKRNCMGIVQRSFVPQIVAHRL